VASGDVTEVFDNRLRQPGRQPISHFTLEIVMAVGTLEKEEEVMANMLLTDIYFEAPDLDPSANTIQLELLTERGNVIYDTGALDASGNTGDEMSHSIHFPDASGNRALYGTTTVKLTADADVSENITNYIEFFGM